MKNYEGNNTHNQVISMYVIDIYVKHKYAKLFRALYGLVDVEDFVYDYFANRCL